MKNLLIIFLLSSLTTAAQLPVLGIDSDTQTLIITQPKDTSFDEVVKAKFYLYINDSTIKTIIGFHTYHIYEYAPDPWWHETRQPMIFESYTDSNNVGLFKTYPNANILKVEDIETPKKMLAVKNRYRSILN